MDNYPKAWAPEIAEDGSIQTNFDDWWAKNSCNFPGVPECVARQWLYRHWNNSPYSWLPSQGAEFQLVEINGNQLMEIAAGAGDTWKIEETLAIGRRHIEKGQFWVASYMRVYRTWPKPVIVLDNKSGALHSGQGFIPSYQPIVTGLNLIEGHRRYECAVFLHSTGRLKLPLTIWQLSYQPVPVEGPVG